VTLEFDKVVPQVERMGRALAARNITLSERGDYAWQILDAMSDLEAIHARIKLARERDAGFRGAAPLHEPVNRAYPRPKAPDLATILAADGSQIYPNTHGAALYYLTNVGVFVYHHGLDDLPEQITEPVLSYTETLLYDERGQVISNAAVNARRTVHEIQTLAREVWNRRTIGRPILAISDGPLLFWVGKDVPNGHRLQDDYLAAMVHLHDAHTALYNDSGHSASAIGYVDRPTSSFVVSLVYLMSLAPDDVRRAALETNGPLEGLTDQWLMFRLLRPGERSALFVQQSPQNKRYRDRGESYEIVFFYLNVGQPQAYHLARIEMPMWVARDPARVDQVHALVMSQCEMMWRYPYALTRADELAVVRNIERTQLEQLIEIELRKNEQIVELSEKLEAKVVRHGRKRYGERNR
jgi:hypothetical protein